MGAAKEHRNIAANREWFDARLREKRETQFARATIWRDLIEEGHLLAFTANNGTPFTIGRYQTATGDAKYAQLWHGKHAREYRDVIGSAWHVALVAVEYCGRGRPTTVDGKKV